MTRLYLTPLDDYSVLRDIQHFKHFNSHLISALLQVPTTFLMKGWTPVCLWGSVGLGNTAPREQWQHRSHISLFLCHRGSSQECPQTWQGTTGWGHGGTDFGNSALALRMCIKQHLILTEHPLCQGKHQECQDLLGRPNITLGWTRTFITVSGADIFGQGTDVPDSRLYPSHFESST